MRSLKFQFALAYAVAGAVAPLLPLLLEEDRRLSKTEIGTVMAFANVAVLTTPLVMTWLADARFEARRIIRAVFLAIVAVVALLVGTESFLLIAILVAAWHLLFSPLVPLQDGLFFAADARRVVAGAPPTPYQSIRVWGTIGFIVPSFLVAPFLSDGVVGAGRYTVTLYLGAIAALVAFANTFFLPSVAADRSPRGRAPLGTAIRAFMNLRSGLFCLTIGVLQLAVQAWATYFPAFLSEDVGIEKRWVGLVMTVGVAVEILWMLALGKLLRRFGSGGVIALGAAAMALRVLLSCVGPYPVVEVATQPLHGIMALPSFVTPPLYVNQLADESCRSSVQGLYATFVVALPRILGNLVAGPLAEKSVIGVFWWVAGLTAAAAMVIRFAIRPEVDERLRARAF